MNCHKFDECNVTIAENQEEYSSLRGYRSEDDRKGTLIVCWNLTLMERLVLLFTGKLWHSILTFHRPLQQSRLSVEKPEWLEEEYNQSLYTLSKPAPKSLTMYVPECAVCFLPHEDVILNPSIEARRAKFTHEGVCPTRGATFYATASEAKVDE